jgi:hypothetical protein
LTKPLIAMIEPVTALARSDAIYTTIGLAEPSIVMIVPVT